MKLFYHSLNGFKELGKTLNKNVLKCVLEIDNIETTIENHVKNNPNKSLDHILELDNMILEAVIKKDNVTNRMIITLYEIKNGEPEMYSYHDFKDLVKKIKSED